MAKRLTKQQLAAATVAAAMRCHDLRLWQDVLSQEPFAICVPGEAAPMIGSILGANGLFGLQLLRGTNALRDFLSILDPDRPSTRSLLAQQSVLSYSITRRQDLDPAGREYLELANFHKRLVPGFVIKPAGRQARTSPRRDEAELLLWVSNAIVAAHGRGLFRPRPCTSLEDTLLKLDVSGDIGNPDVTVTVDRLVSPTAEAVVPIAPDADIGSLPQVGGKWFVGLPVLSVSLDGDDRVVHGVVVYDVNADRLLQMRPVPGHDLAKFAAVLFDAFRGQGFGSLGPGLPREIQFSSVALFAALSPGLESLGITCHRTEWIPVIDTVVRGFEDFLQRGGEDFVPPDESDTENDVRELPDDPKSVEEWKAVDEAASRGVHEIVADKGLTTRKAAATYFGDPERRVHPEDELLALLTFVEWLATDYRAKQGRRTLLERLVDGPLPPAVRQLYLARIESTPSIWIVDAVSEQAGTLDLRDMLSDASVVVHDASLSQSAVRDFGLPARVFCAGPYHFLAPLGPPVPSGLLAQACSFLEEQGMTCTRFGMAARPHLLGRLWGWLEAASAAFESTQETELTADTVLPADDRAEPGESAELPAEAEALLQRSIDKSCMAWLDEPVPALGQKTPREACRSLEGRQAVERLIRAWPSPGGSERVSIPRAAMLRELGLDAGEAWG